jgi:predicted MPP superfamily phosphohydrolase
VIYLLSAALGAGVAFLWFLGRRAAAPSSMLSRERRLDFPRLPPEYDGLRVLHVSDPHLTPRTDCTDAIIARADAARPDLIAVTGDLVSGWRGLPLARRLLERLASRWPTYVVAGNADHWADYRRGEVARWNETGARVLMNEGRPFGEGDSGFWIAGVNDPYRFRDDPRRALAHAPPGAFKLLLAHTPEVIERREALGADLILSGHTHGGQVRLPWIGALVTRTRLDRKFSRGVFRLNGTVLVISSGIGATRLSVRFFCPPEMTLWVLRRGGGEQEAGSRR